MTAELPLQAQSTVRRSGFIRRFGRNPLVVVASVFVVLAAIAAVVATQFLDPFAFGDETFGPPSLTHLMGTDHLGRDIFAQVVHGVRSALFVGLGASLIAAIVGSAVGAVAGFFGGPIDEVLMRMTDVMLSVPNFFVVLLVATLFEGGLPLITLLLGFTVWTGTARVVRAEVLVQRERGYVEAARGIGASNSHLLLREILPNSVYPAIALISLIAAWAILAEAGLSFLGLRDANTVTFGWMLNVALDHYNSAWWMVVFPGLVLSLLVFALNLIGDGFIDAMNPRVREGRGKAVMKPKSHANRSRRGAPGGSSVLKVQDLAIEFPVGRRPVQVVDGITFEIAPGEVVGLVGESGSGKTMTALAIAGLIPNPGYVARGSVVLDGVDVATASPEDLERVRAESVAITFQDPQSSLNPLMTVGDQIAESLTSVKEHSGSITQEVVAAMESVRIPAAAERAQAYPHQLSGGMRQRVLLAMALVRKPKLLILDEPTTALDVITQDEILELVRESVEGRGLAVLLITHDLSVVAQTCSRVEVMYCGRLVESAATDDLLKTPRHPYTQGLVNSISDVGGVNQRLVSIGGYVPQPDQIPPGCAFNPRCPAAMDRCKQEVPLRFEVSSTRASACWLEALPDPNSAVAGVWTSGSAR